MVRQLLTREFFDFADLPTPNAIAFRCPSDDSYGIIIDHKLFGWTSDIVLAALALRASPKLHRRKNLATVADFLSLSLGFRRASPSGAQKAMFDFRDYTAEYRDLSGLMEDFIRLFVAAHEVGHIALGHLDASAVTEMRMTPSDVEAHVSAKLHKQEYEADEFAMELLFHVFYEKQDAEANNVLLSNARLFFEAQKFISRFRNADNGRLGEQNYANTHPEPADRSSRLFHSYCAITNAPASWDRDTEDLVSQILLMAEEKRISMALKRKA